MAGTGRWMCERLLATREMKTYPGFKFNLNGGTPVAASSSVYTQTANSTVSRTQIAAAATTAATSTTPFGYTTQAQADAIRAAANRALELINGLIDDLQARGIVS